MYGLMWKTVSEDCNLACDYCYYSNVLGRPQEIRRPSPKVLDKALKDYMGTCGSVANIVWQGGEPLLAGLDFFEQVVSLEARYARPNTVISNTIQTNGTLLNDKWMRFLKTYRFFIGISIDGPEQVHNARRVDGGGNGSFKRVMRGLNYLIDYDTPFNILTVIGPHNVRKPADLLNFYRENHLRWVQFIPEMSFVSQQVAKPGHYAITPREYGDFLCEVFDIWFANDRDGLSIRFFDNVLQTYMDLKPEICTMNASCPQRLVLESNGDIYPCDFYIDQEWKIGNVATMTLSEALESPRFRAFMELKPRLPTKCQSCEWLSHCQGGCPRNRNWGDSSEDNPDYFCDAFTQFFTYTHERLDALAEHVRGNLIKVR